MLIFCRNAFLITRIFYISIIVFIYSIFDRYDKSNELACDIKNVGIIENILLKFLTNFHSYDSVHFIHIAQNRQTNDKNFAFFPVFPLIIEYGQKIIEYSIKILFQTQFICPKTGFLLSGFILSNLICFLNTLTLEKIAAVLNMSTKKSRLIIILFLTNPGTIFYISIYTENLYFFLHLLLITSLILRSKKDVVFDLYNVVSFIVFGILIVFTRSNGIFLCIYFLIPLFKLYVNPSEKFFQNLILLKNTIKANFSKIFKILVILVHSYLCFIIVTKILPYFSICVNIRYFMNHNSYETEYKNILYETNNLCYRNETVNFYSIIQKKYWDVSMFSQYRFEYIDRILLSLPMNILAILIIVDYVKRLNYKSIINLNFNNIFVKEHIHHDHNHNCNEEDSYRQFIVLLIFINFVLNFIVLVLYAHPQINNRVLTSNPLIYIYIVDEIFKRSWKGYYAILFFSFFSILSCIMQSGSYGFA